jgi:DNA invertase Pin-like site-specific DNA recombinase
MLQRGIVLVTDMLRAAIYCRLPAPTGNADEDRGIELKEIASARGWTVVATFSDQANPTTARSNSPGLDALLQAAARREFDVLVVQSLSHLATTLSALIRVLNELGSHGIDLLACDDGIDTSPSAGKSAFAAFVALAQFERTLIRERARISLDRARRNGTRLGRPSNMNPGVRAAIIALHERGVSVRRIARQLRVGHATISKALQAAATHPAPKGSQTSRNGIRTPLKPLERTGNRVPA